MAGGWIGSALEYDFFIYAQAAALVFPQVFFPKGNPSVALTASLATYAVGYVARPVGAFVLGHWGDRHGRKNVLVLAMLLMGVSTFAVALLPTYGQVGILASVLLVVLRLVQGFAVAGELGGASAMIVEHAPFGRRGYYASFALQGTQAGQIIAAAVRTRVTGFAISQNIGLAITAFLPTVFAVIAPPGSDNVPLVIGGSFLLRVIGAVAAWSAKETHRIPLEDLGKPDAAPVAREEFARIRAGAA